MATELAKAYVQLVPSAQGIKGSIAKVMDGEAESAGKSAGGKFASMFGSALKIGEAGVAAASAALVKVGKDAIAEFADYEQLIGGVETLFKENADAVAQNAARAFQTAGLSANEYMETVTGFSASLLQSLGGDIEAAAKIGDMAIRDMADNANKMGSSMESIQNAYQGFAKQNYTMLDNLKLGYGGTKSEMERLLADAEKFSGVRYDIGNLSDVYEAIHVVQGELHISGRTAEEAAEIIARTGRSSEEVYEQLGTTAKEASSTISGSLAATKAAWHNLLVGASGDTADISALVDGFVDSAVTAGENIIPRVDVILDGLGDMLTQSADKLVPIVVSTIINNLPAITGSGVKLVATLASAIIGAIPQLVRATPDIIIAIVNGLVAGWPSIRQAGGELVDLIKSALLTAVGAAKTWGRDLLSNFIQGIRDKFASLKSAVADAANTVKRYLGFSEPEVGPLSNFHTYAPDMMELFSRGIRDNLNTVRTAAQDAAQATRDGWADSFPPAKNSVPEDAKAGSSAEALVSALREALDGMGVYMDGDRVGRLVTRGQSNTARAYG